jgi:hypothetical protein
LAKFEHSTWQQQKSKYDRLHFQLSEQEERLFATIKDLQAFSKEIKL